MSPFLCVSYAWMVPPTLRMMQNRCHHHASCFPPSSSSLVAILVKANILIVTRSRSNFQLLGRNGEILRGNRYSRGQWGERRRTHDPPNGFGGVEVFLARLWNYGDWHRSTNPRHRMYVLRCSFHNLYPIIKPTKDRSTLSSACLGWIIAGPRRRRVVEGSSTKKEELAPQLLEFWQS